MGGNCVCLAYPREASTRRVYRAVGELGCDGKAVRHDGNCVFRHDVEPCDFVLLSRHFHLSGS